MMRSILRSAFLLALTPLLLTACSGGQSVTSANDKAMLPKDETVVAQAETGSVPPSTLACQPTTISGNGSTIANVEPQAGCRFLIARCEGDSNFQVTAFDSYGKRIQGIVNEICGEDGYYKWEMMWNPDRDRYSSIEVSANGGWSLDVR